MYSQTGSGKNKNRYSNHSSRGQNSVNICLFIILSIALFFRLFHLGHQSFWSDEIISMVHAQKTVTEIIFLNENFPPLYNLILHFQLYLGQSEIIARLPSVGFGFGSVIFLFFCLRRYSIRRLLSFLPFC